MSGAYLSESGRKTKTALFLSSILHEPLSILYSTFLFILYKDLNASAFQITLLATLKPVVTLFSFYWSAGSRGRVRANVLGAGLLMRVPFLLCPWFDSPWYLVAAAVNYMLFYRAGMPCWMEILKRNLKKEERDRAFSLSTAVGYGEGVVLALAMGAMLDHDPLLWKWLFVGGALLGIVGAVLQAQVPVVEEVCEKKVSLKELLVRPWRDSWELLRSRRDFALFQWGFMLCGFALMLLQVVVPLFAVDVLGVSYKEMAVAICVAKGLGFVATSQLWARLLNRYPIQQLASWVCLTFVFYPSLLGLSGFHVMWFYLAYFCYGVGQAGSHLVWSMSGPHYAGKEESARFTGVGVVLCGVRGLVGPGLGSVMYATSGSLPVVAFGVLLCLVSGLGILKPNVKKSLEVN
jgi:hypothetical protein